MADPHTDALAAHQPTDADDRFGDCVACGEPWPCTTDQLGDTRAELLHANARADAAEADRDRHHTTLTAIADLFSGGPDSSCRTTWRRSYLTTSSGMKVSSPPVECVEVPLDDLRAVLADAAAAATQQDTPGGDQ